MGKLAVIGKPPGPEINRTVLSRVCIILLHKAADHPDHPVNLLRSLRMDGGGLYVHACHILFTFLYITLRNDRSIHSLFLCGLYYLVIHIGKVGNISHLIALMLHIAPYRIKDYHGPRVSDMDQVIDRGPADVHAYLSGLYGLKLLFFS